MTRTNQLTHACVNLLRAKGAFAWRNSTVGIFDPVKKQYRTNSDRQSIGAADILAVYRGVPIAVEVKVGKDRQRPEQKRWAEALTAAGGIYIIAQDTTDAVIELLNKLDGQTYE